MLLQKLPAEQFVATASIDATSLAGDSSAGVVVFGMDYALLRARRTGDGVIVEQIVCRGADQGAAESVVATRRPRRGWSSASRSPAAWRCSATAWIGQRFHDLGDRFEIKPGKWVGAKIGLVATRPGTTSDGGYADVDWFRVRPMPRTTDVRPVRNDPRGATNESERAIQNRKVSVPMTLHVCVRPISSLLLLAAILLRPPTPAIAQAVSAAPAAPTLAERLERLAAEIERNRVDLHVPGAALAIVRGEEVIFAQRIRRRGRREEDARHAGDAVLHRLDDEGVHRDARRDAGGRGAHAVGRSG